MAMTFVDNVKAIPTLEKANIPWGAAPTPVEKDGDLPWVSSWTDLWGVFSDSQHAEAAKEFVAFVGTEGNRLRAQTGQMPLNKVIKLARPAIVLPANIFSIDGPLWDEFGLIIDGEKTAQQALDEAAPDIQNNLDRAWSTWEEI